MPFLDLLPFKGPFPLTGALTGRPPYGKVPYGHRPLTGRLLTRRPPTNYRKAYGKLRGGTLPELGGNFRLCAVDQKRSFFARAVLFLGLLPFKGPFPLTGALTGRPPYGPCYGEAGEGRPYRKGSSLREGPLRGWVPSQRRTTKRLTGSPLQGRTVLTGRAGPCRDPELGGNFRLCAVDQKRPFLIRVGPFLDLLPFKGPFPLRGALYGEACMGRRLTGRLLTGRPLTGRPLAGRLLTGSLLTGRPLTRRPIYGETLTGRPLRGSPLRGGFRKALPREGPLGTLNPKP